MADRLERAEREGALRHADELLSRAPLVAEAALVPRPGGGRPWAVALPDAVAIERERFVNLYEAIRFRLESAAVPLPVTLRHAGLTLVREPLPRRPDGSVDRDELARRIGEDPPRVWPARPRATTPVPDAWRPLIERALPGGDAGRPLLLEHSLEFDHGLDSLDRMAFLVALGGATGVQVTDDVVTSVRTLGDAIDRLGPLPPVPGTPEPPTARTVLRTGPRAIPASRLAPGTLRWLAVRLIRAIVWPLTRWRFGCRVVGLDRADWDERPLLIASNHQSHMDAALLAGALPPRIHRQVLFLGFTGYFAEGWGRLVGRLFDIVPISADRGALDGLRAGLDAAEAGRIVCIYPEGERTWDGTLRPFKRGVAWMAREAGARVVPAAIVGAYQAWPRGWPLESHPITLLFGAPIDPPPPGSGVEEERAFLDALHAAIAALLVEGGHDPESGDPEVWANGPRAALARRRGGEVVSAG